VASVEAAGGEKVIEPALAPEPAVLGPDARWDALKQMLPKPVGSLLMDARLASVREGLVRIEFRYPAHAELMNGAKNKETLLAAVREVFGPESARRAGRRREAGCRRGGCLAHRSPRSRTTRW